VLGRERKVPPLRLLRGTSVGMTECGRKSSFEEQELTNNAETN
jgi:hypothetical protein